MYKIKKINAGLCIVILCWFSFTTQALVILQYHHIDEDTPASTSTSPALFKQHLDYLHKHEFKVLSMPQFLQHLNAKKEFPDKSVLITFDDGYRSILDNGLAPLKAKNYPFTVFVNSRHLHQSDQSLMGVKELQELVESGATIANHTVSHAHLIRKKWQERKVESNSDWQDRIRAEIIDAQVALEKTFSDSPKVLAYPYGEYSSAVRELVAQLGFIAFAQQSGAVDLNSDRFAFPRFPMGGNYGNMQSFKQKVNTLAMPIKALELLSESGELLDDILPLDIDRPKLKIKLQSGFDKLNLQCFSAGKVITTEKQIDGSWIVQSKKPLKSGRSIYTCTAASNQKGRYYWFSTLWIKT